MTKYRLVITLEADQDLSNLYENGFKTWGELQADKYYEALLTHFDVLCENPLLYRSVDEIRKGYRRSVCGKHSIFYRVVDDTVEGKDNRLIVLGIPNIRRGGPAVQFDCNVTLELNELIVAIIIKNRIFNVDLFVT